MSITQSSEDSYVVEFLACLSKERATTLSDRVHTNPHLRTRAFLRSKSGRKTLHLADILPRFDSSIVTSSDSPDIVVVVENIDLRWIAAIGSAWQISPSFFAQHVVNPTGSDLWEAIIGPSSEERYWPGKRVGKTYAGWIDTCSWHVDGIFGCDKRTMTVSVETNGQNVIPRLASRDDEYGIHISSRISLMKCAGVGQSLCLILVDVPVVAKPIAHLPTSSSKVRLYLPLSLNRGGLVLPQLFGLHEHSLYDCLDRFLSHDWHLRVLLDTGDEILTTPEVFFYLLVSSTWETNLRYLEVEIKRIGLEEIRKPTTAINNMLHDRREDLDSLRSLVNLAIRYMPKSVSDSFNALRGGLELRYMGLPDRRLQDIIDRSQSLEKFLMASFSLLISSTSLMEAEAAVQQGIRAQRLTVLAFLYIPLSFVTGIFGMNVKEINGSSLPIWVAIVTLVVTLLVTATVFALFIGWENRRSTTSALRYHADKLSTYRRRNKETRILSD